MSEKYMRSGEIYIQQASWNVNRDQSKNTRASKSLKEWEQSNVKFTHSYKNCSYENGYIQWLSK